MKPLLLSISGILLLIWCLGKYDLSHSDSAGTEAADAILTCPHSGCEVATNEKAYLTLVLHETDTPGENGLFDSRARAEAYDDAILKGGIITVPNNTECIRRYDTPDRKQPFSIVTIAEGEYAGKNAIVGSERLTSFPK